MEQKPRANPVAGQRHAAETSFLSAYLMVPVSFVRGPAGCGRINVEATGTVSCPLSVSWVHVFVRHDPWPTSFSLLNRVIALDHRR